ncbi:hypothetical protein JAO29_04300 [Edaphobacter sp. HDX4]|uniref:hypothetical protein n=1 Tax=Edaphobacter sp. HDX4 TaxID=2794064 RepID=UPI002FE58F45
MVDEKLLPAKRIPTNIVALSICGVAIGWMIGLATSPVIERVLESILGIAGAVVATLAGIKVAAKAESDSSSGINADAAKIEAKTKVEPKSLIEINAWPVAMFCLLLAGGSSLGLMARARDWFRPDPNRFIGKWSASTKLKPEVLAKVLLGSEYPESPSAEMREEMLPRFAKGGPEVTYADLSRVIAAMYPVRPAGQEVSGHPSEGFGLKDDQANPPTCRAILDAKKANPADFDLANQISSKFTADFTKCSSKGAACALKIWSDKCI